MKIFEYTDKGPRVENEDSIKSGFINEKMNLLACIADGVGGERCGKMASSYITDYFFQNTKSFESNLEIIVRNSHSLIKEMQLSSKDCFKMASTFTGCILSDNLMKGVHVGDTRLCVLRGDGLKQITESHTEVFRFFKAGKINYSDIENYPRRHVLDSAIGISGELKLQKFTYHLQSRDRILLTSDGVHDVITKTEFRDLSVQTNELEQLGERIVRALKAKRLSDNVSFIIVEVS